MSAARPATTLPAPTARLVAAACLCAWVLAGCSIASRRPAPAPTPEIVPPPANVDTTPDAIPRREPRSAHGNPPFYKVLGKRYVVLASADGYFERGVASWYGPTFHGESTSSGEKYDMYGMTAAHKTLPLPTYARVTNLKNGRSIVVRINDRGPFVANRLIDLSYSAAAKLDMLKEGTTLVEVKALTLQEPDNLTRSAETPPPSLYVQAGAFSDQHNAQRVLDRLHAGGLPGAFIFAPPDGNPPSAQASACSPSDQGDSRESPVRACAPPSAQASACSPSDQGDSRESPVRACAPPSAQASACSPSGRGDSRESPVRACAHPLYRVRLGPISSVPEFDQLAAKLKALGFPDARLAAD
jgi:rare lipoprotein A